MSSLCKLASRRTEYLVCRSRSGAEVYRWYSKNNGTRKSMRLGNFLVGSAIAVGIGGSIVYGIARARNDPEYKKRVDAQIPKFAAIVDTIDEMLKKGNGFIAGQSHIDDNRSSSTVVYQHSDPKPKPDLSKILKGDPSLTQKKTLEENVGSVSVEKPTEVVKEPSDHRESKVAGVNLGSGEDKSNTESHRETAAEVQKGLESKESETRSSDLKSPIHGAADVQSGFETKEVNTASSLVSVEELGKSVAGSADIAASSTEAKEEPKDKTVVDEKEVTETVTQVVELEASSPSAEESGPSGISSVKIDEGPTIKAEPEAKTTPMVIPVPPVSEDPRFRNPSQQVELLEETYARFLEDCREVSKAQEQLKEAWQDLYNRVMSPMDVEGMEQQINDAKQANSLASNHLGTVMDSYKRSTARLEEVIKRASDGGHVAKATEVDGEMKVKMAEIDLSLILLKELVASASVAESYKRVVGKTKAKLQRDLEAASSLVDPANKDSLIRSLSKKLEILQHKLEQVDIEYHRNVIIALEVQKSELEELSEKKLECSLKESDAKHRRHLTKVINEEAAKHKAALTQQMDYAHEMHLAERREALQALHGKLELFYSEELKKRLAAQATIYQHNLTKAHAKLAGIERMVDSVADAGEKTIRYEVLQRSCDSLVETLEQINSDPDYDDHRYVLDTDFSSFREAARGDSFITATLDSIPSQAVQGAGIQSERKLRERFGKVRRTCRGVALVPPEGGGPFLYLLSYIQSILTFSKTSLPDVIDYSVLEKMDTYSILCLAERRMKNGDLEGVVDCMAFLKGEPKRIARDWLQDARVYLETRQAIELLQTYMRAKTFM